MLTEAQKKERRKGIGGSDVAAICNKSKYRTPLDIYLEKHGLTENEIEETDAQFIGSHTEPLLRKLYKRRTGHKVEKTDQLYAHKHHNFIIGNLDGIIKPNNYIFEGKTANSRQSHEWGDPGTSEIPVEYLLQVAHYCMLTEIQIAHIGAKIDSSDFRIYVYERNPILEKKLLNIENKFWNEYVLPKIPPPPQNAADVEKIFPEHQIGKKIVATDEISETVLKLYDIKKQIAELEKMKEQTQFIIKLYISDAEILEDAFGKKIASYKTQSSNRLDISTLKKIHPDLFNKYVTTSNSRVLRSF